MTMLALVYCWVVRGRDQEDVMPIIVILAMLLDSMSIWLYMML